MTFETSDPSFTADQMAELMSALRIVFYNTETGDIYAEARLNMTENADGSTNYLVEGGKVTGYMYLIEEVDGTINYKAQEEADITTLDQGVGKKVSVLVYLDGTIVDNSMVPTKGSMNGTMNLQFSSSAELTPMNYGEYQNPSN